MHKVMSFTLQLLRPEASPTLLVKGIFLNIYYYLRSKIDDVFDLEVCTTASVRPRIVLCGPLCVMGYVMCYGETLGVATIYCIVVINQCNLTIRF